MTKLYGKWLAKARSVAMAAAALVAGCAMVSCKEKPKTAKELYNSRATGVALIQNRYFYTMDIAGIVVHFTDADSAGTMKNETADISRASANAAMRYGVAFFVSGDGSMMTNRHVVRPQLPDTVAKAAAAAFIARSRKKITALRDSAVRECASLRRGGKNAPPHSADTAALLARRLRDTDRYNSILAQLEMAMPENARITASCRIGAAFTGQHVSESEGFAPCSVTRVSGIDSIDLALVRLEGKQTPRSRHTLRFRSGTKGKRTLLETYWQRARRDYKGRRLSPGVPICAIGYAQTPESGTRTVEIQAVARSGKIISNSQKGKMFHNIRLPHIAHGAPVVNMYGDVVGVSVPAPTGKASPYLHGAKAFCIPARQAKEFLGIFDE